MKTLVKMQSHADSSVMEAVNHLKNRGNLIFSMIFALVASIFMFYACGNDDDGGGSNNFVYSEGFIENYGGNGGGVYNFDVTLHSSSMDFENGTGSGNFLFLELWSSSSSGLANGKYTFSNSPKALSYTDGGIGIGYNLSTDRGQYLEIEDGDVNISTSGGETNISFEVTVEGNRKITGSYKGVLTMFDYTGGNGGGGGTTLSAPTGVTASQSGSSVNVSWNSVSGATSYIVYRSSSSSGTFTQIGTSNSTSYTDSSPLSGNNSYRIVAVNNSGTSSQSSTASVNFTGGGGGTPPSTPTGVTASQSGTSVNVSWSSVSGATSYIVYRSSSASGTFTQIGTPSSTSYTDNSPLSGNNSYRVAAVNNAGTSSQSSTASVNFTSGGGGTAPSVPTGVSASLSSSNVLTVNISWNAVTGATGYRVYHSTSSNGPFTAIGSPSTTSHTHNLLYISPGNQFYRVRAINSAGESNQSSNASVNHQGRKLDTPTNLQANTGLGNFVQVSFTAVSLAQSYELQRATSATGSYSNVASGSATTLTDSNPQTGTRFYRVRAISSSSTPGLINSDWSSPVSITR